MISKQYPISARTNKNKVNRNRLFILILLLLVATACKKEKDFDIREQLIGTYTGEKLTSYYYLNEEDTSLTVCENKATPASVLIGMGECENCLTVILDPEDTTPVADTISIDEGGNYEKTFILIGENYYREYSIEFDEDSLFVSYHQAGEAESFRYGFRGKRINK